MKQIIYLFLIAMALSTTLTSCELIGDIFQAGMAVGVFVVIAVVAVIIWLVSRFRK